MAQHGGEILIYLTSGPESLADLPPNLRHSITLPPLWRSACFFVEDLVWVWFFDVAIFQLVLAVA